MLCHLLAAAAAAAVAGHAPATFTVTFSTDVKPSADSSFDVAVNRSWAPLGADRLYAAVNDGFYDNSAFFRVVPKFVVQFGISGSATENKKWLHNKIKDDPVLVSNTLGTVVFATAGPDTRTTQLFINFGDNSRLDSLGFAPFGKVVGNGMTTTTKIFNPTPGHSGGVDQDKYESRGNKWIKKTYPLINFIVKAKVTQEA